MDSQDQSDRFDRVRRGLKGSDKIDGRMPMNEDFFERLHDKIMSEVEKTEIQPLPKFHRSKNLLREHWRGWLYPVGGLTSLMLLVALVSPQVSNVNHMMQRAGLFSDGQERIADHAWRFPGELSQTFISSQSDSDFFMDVAAESFENLSVAKFNKIVGEIRR